MTTVVVDSLKLTFPCDAMVFVGVSLTGSKKKRQRLFSLLICIFPKPLAIASMIALQVVRTSFRFHLRECMGSCSPSPPPPPPAWFGHLLLYWLLSHKTRQVKEKKHRQIVSEKVVSIKDAKRQRKELWKIILIRLFITPSVTKAPISFVIFSCSDT